MYGHARLFGALEAGGTKFVCAVGDESGALHADSRFPTADPESTLARVRDFFKVQLRRFRAGRVGRRLLRSR